MAMQQYIDDTVPFILTCIFLDIAIISLIFVSKNEKHLSFLQIYGSNYYKLQKKIQNELLEIKTLRAVFVFVNFGEVSHLI